MNHAALRSVYYPVLDGGMRLKAAPRTLTPQTPPHYFRRMQNLASYQGLLRRREGLFADTGGVATILGVAIDRNTAGNHQYVLGLFDLSLWPTSTGIRMLVVTDKELWIVNASSPFAYNITPIYSTGTVNVTNGSNIITGGGGQLWQTNNVGDDNLILIDTDSAWNILDTVTGEDQGTLASNFTGTTGARTYTLRRSFFGLKEQSAKWTYYGVHARVVLDDVYVAGMFGRYWTGSAYAVTGAVLKIAGGADPLKTSFAASDVSYIASSEDMDAGGSMEVFDRFFAPLGLEVGENGNLIMPAHMGVDGSGDPAGASRVWYNSFDDDTEWTLTPGGSADQVQKWGKMTAQGRLGRAITLHFDDQIVLASPTGGADPPLSYIRSRATIGAGAPRLIVPVPGGDRCPSGDFFIGVDGRSYVFNGDSSVVVDTGFFDVISDYRGKPYFLGWLHQAFLGYDSARREVSCFFPDDVAGSTPATTATLELRWNIDTGAMTRQRYAIPITAMANAHYSDFIGSVNERIGNQTKAVGSVSRGNSTDGVLLYALADHRALDGAPALVSGETPGGCWFELDDLDFGEPVQYMKLLWVLVWVVGEATTTETLKCRISSDEGTTFVELTESVSLTLGAETLVIFNFEEQSAPAAPKWKVRLESNSTDTLSMAFRGAHVFAAPAADARAA